MMIVTTNDLAGYRVETVIGRVFGAVAHSKPSANVVLPSTSVELPNFTAFTVAGRQIAADRMSAEALRLGANAVLAASFESTRIADSMIEVVSSGTAVVVRPLPEGDPGATTQSAQQAASLAAQVSAQATVQATAG